MIFYEDFEYPEPCGDPPGIVPFSRQQAEFEKTIRLLKVKLDPDGQALLRIALKQFIPIVKNYDR